MASSASLAPLMRPAKVGQEVFLVSRFDRFQMLLVSHVLMLFKGRQLGRFCHWSRFLRIAYLRSRHLFPQAFLGRRFSPTGFVDVLYQYRALAGLCELSIRESCRFFRPTLPTSTRLRRPCGNLLTGHGANHYLLLLELVDDQVLLLDPLSTSRFQSERTKDPLVGRYRHHRCVLACIFRNFRVSLPSTYRFSFP